MSDPDRRCAPPAPPAHSLGIEWCGDDVEPFVDDVPLDSVPNMAALTLQAPPTALYAPSPPYPARPALVHPHPAARHWPAATAAPPAAYHRDAPPRRPAAPRAPSPPVDIPAARHPHTRVQQLQAEAAQLLPGSAGNSDGTAGSYGSSGDDRLAFLTAMQDSHAARRPVTTAPHPAAYPRHDLLAHPWPARPNSVPPQPLPQTQLYLSAKQSPPHVVFQKITLLQSQKHATKPTERYRPVAEEYSFLECVVELLKGTVVHRKKNVLQGVEARVWLRADMEALEYKLLKKGVVPRNHQIKLCNVRKVKGSEKDLQLDIVGEKRPIDFAFRTAKELNIWLSALCCLVPRQATVKKNHSRIENRWDYNPLQDTWNDKSVCQRKMVRELLILGTIGTGATAKVKAALSTTERRFYAVKVISKATIWKTRRMGSRFGRGMLGRAGDLTMDDLEEATVLKDLRHDNIVRLYAVFEDEDLEMFYYVTEYLPRGPVMRSHSVQTEKRLNEDTARSAFVDVVAGLEYLHRNNVVHRDIKPDNLLTSGDGTVKISDFGAAIMYIDEEEAEREEEGEGGREEEHAKGNGSGREREGNGRGTGKRARKSQNLNIGTPAFTAPELCISEHAPQCPERCFAADIWSLGATLFYFIYGRPPHLEKNVLNMYDVICTDDVTFPPEPVIGSNLKKLLQRTLARKPEERATIAQIVQSPWLTKDVHISEKLKEIKRRVEGILV